MLGLLHPSKLTSIYMKISQGFLDTCIQVHLGHVCELFGDFKIRYVGQYLFFLSDTFVRCSYF